jgi:starch-binding outer membrane protein, SusD/RagB family
MTSLDTPRAFVRRSRMRVVGAVAAAAAALTAGCKDSNVPYLTAPTSIANTPTGIQNAVTGLFSATRNDVGSYITFLSTFARDNGAFFNVDPRYITEGTGIVPIPNNDEFLSSSVWDNEFRDATSANQILTSLPNVAPSLSSDTTAAIAGIVQTMKALKFMMLAETRDTLGVSVYSIDVGSGPLAPVYCNKDVWAYIVALLDSANTQLNQAGSTPLPVTLPAGFGSVSVTAGPSTVQGSFAAFNRALAGKAGLEYAYAIARQSGAGATPTSAGSPNAAALTRADSAIKASALFNPAAITPPPVSGFINGDPYTVSNAWSAQSGDQVNPINGEIGSLAILWDLVADVDTVHDARWAAKFGLRTAAVGQTAFSGIASPYLYTYYNSPSSPTPIVRNEELTLVDAQIQLGLGNYGNAITLINDVHEQAGGYAAPLSIAATYTAVRDSLMKEQRISTVLEGSEDRLIAIRLYGMEAVSDTTWDATSGPDAAGAAAAVKSIGPFTDLHTTILPPPATEVDGRGGSYTLSCP